MTDHLTKTHGSFPVPQDDQVVDDPDKSPVCLNSIPGTHKDLAKSEALLDVLVEGFDPDPLKVKSDYLRFGHFEVVGKKKLDTILLGSGNKRKDRFDLGRTDLELGDAKAFLSGNTDCFVLPRSLGHVTEENLLSVDFHKMISFYRSHEGPFGLDNRIENRNTGIPGVHQHRGFDGPRLGRLGKDLDGQLDFVLEGSGFAGPLGAISADCPTNPLGSDLENTRYGTKFPDESVGPVMNVKPLDLFPLPRARSIVEDQEHISPWTSRGYLATIFALQFPDFLRRCRYELVKTICILLTVFRSNFAYRAEFYKPKQTER